jgi:chromosome segregation ATPase
MQDSPGDITSDTVSMTYKELGDARGISAASAKRLAIRRHWRRTPGNDGVSRVMVPVTETTPRTDVTRDRTGDRPSEVTGDTDAISALREAIAGLLVRAERAENRADRAENRADEAANRAILAEQAIADERNRVDMAESTIVELRVRLDDAHGRLADAQDAADRHHAEVHAALERAEQAEGVRDASLEAANRADAEAAAARDRLQELEAAEDARRVRGRWARLRDAWRGNP